MALLHRTAPTDPRITALSTNAAVAAAVPEVLDSLKCHCFSHPEAFSKDNPPICESVIFSWHTSLFLFFVGKKKPYFLDVLWKDPFHFLCLVGLSLSQNHTRTMKSIKSTFSLVLMVLYTHVERERPQEALRCEHSTRGTWTAVQP